MIGYATLNTKSDFGHELRGMLLCFHARPRRPCYFALGETDDTDSWEYNAWEGGIDTLADALLIASQRYRVRVEHWTLHSGRNRESVFHSPRTYLDRKARRARREFDEYLYRHKYAPRMMRELGLIDPNVE